MATLHLTKKIHKKIYDAFIDTFVDYCFKNKISKRRVIKELANIKNKNDPNKEISKYFNNTLYY